MKIAYVCNEYPPLPHGGIGTFVSVIAHGMLKAGHEIVVVGYGKRVGERHEDGVRVVVLRESNLRGAAWFINRLRLHCWLSREALAGALDVVETPEFCGLMPFRLRRCPVVVRLHQSFVALKRHAGIPCQYTLSWCERNTLKQHRAWIAVSRHILELTRNTFGIYPQRSAVIYNPVVVPSARDLCTPPLPQRFVLFVGAVREDKGAFVLAEACRPLLAQDGTLHLVYVGPVESDSGGSMDKRIRHVIGGELSRRVHFLGRQGHNTILACMKRAIVLALPSRIESFGLAVAEAMACGTPVVYSGIGPGPEVVEDGVSGLLVDPHSATDIAQKISRILGDTDLRRQLVSSALLRVSERFSLERCVDESIEFYDALLTARPR